MEPNGLPWTSLLPCDYNQSLNAAESLSDSKQNPANFSCVFIYEGCETILYYIIVHSHSKLHNNDVQCLFHMGR